MAIVWNYVTRKRSLFNFPVQIWQIMHIVLDFHSQKGVTSFKEEGNPCKEASSGQSGGREAFPSRAGLPGLEHAPGWMPPTWACLLLPTPSLSRHIPSGYSLFPCQDIAGIFQHNHLLAALSQRDIGDVYIPSNGPDPWRQLLYGRNFNVMQ